MPTHTLLFKPNKKYFRNILEKLLESRNISVSQAELRDYSKKELQFLIHKYTKNYNFAKKRNSYWYRESILNNF